ncbi:MAG: hypothetical protein LCH92_08075 [Proteobacteria bacterium]|nr:hypothetical protein [Pseudomonadota bacterium]
MTAPKIPMTISLGNLLTIGVLLVSLTGAWFAMSARVEQVDERSRANAAQISRHGEQLAAGQAAEARTNERLRSIETSLVRIEAGVADLTRYLRENGR